MRIFISLLLTTATLYCNSIFAKEEPPIPATLPIWNDPLPDMIERVSPGIVNISSTTVINYQVYGMDDFLRFWGVPQERKQTALGSGFIISSDGFVLTNNHVVEHATEVLVTLFDKRQFEAKIIGKDDKMDLALLQIRDKTTHKVPENLSAITLGNSDQVRIGETVIAVGNPFGLQHTVTKGIISAKNRTIGLGPLDNFLQTDASINPGNSGGPLFNLKGEVIGINSAIRSGTGQSSGLGFAIPINEAQKLIPDLKKYGRVPRPWLGILALKVTPPLARYYRLGTSNGVLVEDLVEDAPGDLAGLSRGDIIVQVNQIKILEPIDLEKILAKCKPNEKVILQIVRRKRMLELEAQLSELPRLEHLPKGVL